MATKHDIESTWFRVTLEFTEDLLGTIPKNKNIYSEFVASKVVEAGLALEEVETVQEIQEKGWTGFHQDRDGSFIYNYAIKGFLCEAARTVKQYGAIKQLQDKFKRHVFVRPRRIRLPEIAPEPLERSLRAQTAQGPRVTLVKSDVIKAGARITFDVEVLTVSGITQTLLEIVLSYGSRVGLGQWRSGGYGSFETISVEEIAA